MGYMSMFIEAVGQHGLVLLSLIYPMFRED